MGRVSKALWGKHAGCLACRGQECTWVTWSHHQPLLGNIPNDAAKSQWHLQKAKPPLPSPRPGTFAKGHLHSLPLGQASPGSSYQHPWLGYSRLGSEGHPLLSIAGSERGCSAAPESAITMEQMKRGRLEQPLSPAPCFLPDSVSISLPRWCFTSTLENQLQGRCCAWRLRVPELGWREG